MSIDHKLKSGTNTKRALQAVYSMMSWAGDAPPEGWNRTRHVIIIMTDGEAFLLPRHPLISCTFVSPDSVSSLIHFMTLMFPTGLHNMGGDPVTVIQDIRDLLDIGRDRKNPREDYLGEWPIWDPAPPHPHPSWLGLSPSPSLLQMCMCLGSGLWWTLQTSMPWLPKRTMSGMCLKSEIWRTWRTFSSK